MIVHDDRMLAALTWYVKLQEGRKFQWGKHDCWTFVAGWLKQTGWGDLIDGLMARLGEYATARECRRRMCMSGVKANPAFMATLTDMLEMREGEPYAGDIALMDAGKGEWALGISSGRYLASRIYCFLPEGQGDELVGIAVPGTILFYAVRKPCHQ